MMDFFQNIFGKVISLMASVIIAVGLVSVPEIPEQPLQIEKPKEEIAIEKVEVEEIKKEDENKKLSEKTNPQNLKETTLTQSEIEINTSELTDKIRLLDIKTDKLVNSYHAKIDEEISQYLNLVNSFQNKYENEMQETHQRILNETSDCEKVKSLIVDSQGLIRNGLEVASIEFEINSSRAHIFYNSSLQNESEDISYWKDTLEQYLTQINDYSILNERLVQDEIQELLSQINVIKTKINGGENYNGKNYNVSISNASLLLSKMNSLIQEEKERLKTSCQNLPTN